MTSKSPVFAAAILLLVGVGSAQGKPGPAKAAQSKRAKAKAAQAKRGKAKPTPAQAKPQRAVADQKLERLLRELESLPPAAWKAKAARLKQRIAAHVAAARSLEARAKQLEVQASREFAAATRVQAELARLAQLERLVAGRARSTGAKVASSKTGKPAKMSGKKPAAAKSASANKKASKSSVAKASQPKKTPPAKKPVAKKPAAKKPSAKKQVAKKPAAKKGSGSKKAAKAKTSKNAAAAMQSKAASRQPKLLDFETHIFGMLEEHCVVCHDQDEAGGGLDLSSYAALMQGGSSGKSIVVGKPDKSRLYRLVARLERPFMPKDSDPMPKAELDKLKRWIEQGAAENAKTAPAAWARIQAARAKERAAAPKSARVQLDGVMPKGLPGALRRIKRPSALRALAASPRAPLIAIAVQRQVVFAHADAPTQSIGVLDFEAGMVESLCFSADGSKLLVAGGVAGKRGSAEVFDVATGKRIARVGRLRDRAIAAALSPDASLVALGGIQKRVEVYAVASGERLYSVSGHRDWILALDFSRDGAWLASADRAGVLRVTEAPTGREGFQLRGHRGAVHGLRFRPDSKRLASAGADGSVRLWELEDGREVQRINAHSGPVFAIDFASDGSFASVGRDGRLRLWRSGGQRHAEHSAGEWRYSVCCTANGQRVFAGDFRGRLTVFDRKSRKLLKTLVPARPTPRG